jgi:hypothetical protein
MTRKDYVAIAAAISEARMNPTHFFINREEGEYGEGVFSVAVALADRLARDNPRFDRARFLKAAGVQS